MNKIYDVTTCDLENKQLSNNSRSKGEQAMKFCKQGCDVIDFEINFIFLIKLFFLYG